MLSTVLRLVRLTTLAVVASMPPVAVATDAGSDNRLLERRRNVVSTAISDAQADLNVYVDRFNHGVRNALDPSQVELPSPTGEVQADLNANVDSAKRGVQDALNPAQVQLPDMTGNVQADANTNVDSLKQAVLGAPKSARVGQLELTGALLPAGSEHVLAVDAAVDDPHSQRTQLDSSDVVVESDGARWALGLQDVLNTSLSWFSANAEEPLTTTISGVSAEHGSDVSYIVPTATSALAYMSHLLGSAAIYLQKPSMGSAIEAVTDGSSEPPPDILGFLKRVAITMGFA
jgi:hypothetical protein